MGTTRRWLFGPDSMMWTINRESVLLIGGPGSLLMQLAHPSVAAGVGAHSDFRADPLARLRRTLDTMLAIVFGTEEEAKASLERVNSMHELIKGITPDGDPYAAGDPRLLSWVYATLVDSSIKVYSACVRPLSDDEIARYYDEGLVLAPLFGIPDGAFPTSYEDMRSWMRGRIDSGEIRVTELARELAGPILRPVPLIPRRVAEAASFVTTWLLPPPIRAGYGLKLGRGRTALLALGRRASRSLIPLVPPQMRMFPVARRALAVR